MESQARAAYRVGALGRQQAEDLNEIGTRVGRGVVAAGDAANAYIAHREINTGAANAADFTLNHNQAWNDFATGKDIDPNDPHHDDILNARVNNPRAAQQWIQQNLEPDLQKFRDGFLTEKGQEWADHFANTYREHAAIKGAADMSAMAADRVAANIEKTSNTLAVASFQDPRTLGDNFTLLSHSIEGNVSSSPTIQPEHAARIRSEVTIHAEEKLVQSAIQGSIMQGGDWRQIANDPRFSPYVKPGENAQFAKMEETRRKQDAVLSRQQALLEKQNAEANAHASLNQSWSRNVHYDSATGRAVIDPALIQDAIKVPFENPNAPDAVALSRATIDWAESRQHGVDAPANDPDTMKGLNELLYRPGASETDTKIAILQAATNKKLMPDTTKDYLELNTALHQGAIKDPVYEAAMKSAEQIIGTDIEGKKRFADFAFHFMQQYLDARKTGALTPDAMTITKPDGTYDENSLIYKAMKQYMRPPEEIMINTIAQRAGIPAGALPGLSPTTSVGAQPGAAVHVKSLADAQALKPGTHYITPDGNEFIR